MVRDKSGLLGIQSQHLLQAFETLEQPIGILMGAADKLPLPHVQNIATAILLYLCLFKFIMDPEQTLYDPKDCGPALLQFVLCMSPFSSLTCSATEPFLETYSSTTWTQDCTYS
jgi:hypothetical protein